MIRKFLCRLVFYQDMAPHGLALLQIQGVQNPFSFKVGFYAIWRDSHKSETPLAPCYVMETPKALHFTYHDVRKANHKVVSDFKFKPFANLPFNILDMCCCTCITIIDYSPGSQQPGKEITVSLMI